MTPARALTLIVLFAFVLLILAWPVASRISQSGPTVTATSPAPRIVPGDATIFTPVPSIGDALGDIEVRP